MWGLVFSCEAICHEASVQFFKSKAREFDGMRDRAHAQLQWCRGILLLINAGLGIRQASVFSEYFAKKWENAFKG